MLTGARTPKTVARARVKDERNHARPEFGNPGEVECDKSSLRSARVSRQLHCQAGRFALTYCAILPQNFIVAPGLAAKSS